jgi:hypothetical protein
VFTVAPTDASCTLSSRFCLARFSPSQFAAALHTLTSPDTPACYHIHACPLIFATSVGVDEQMRKLRQAVDKPAARDEVEPVTLALGCPGLPVLQSSATTSSWCFRMRPNAGNLSWKTGGEGGGKGRQENASWLPILTSLWALSRSCSPRRSDFPSFGPLPWIRTDSPRGKQPHRPSTSRHIRLSLSSGCTTDWQDYRCPESIVDSASRSE